MEKDDRFKHIATDPKFRHIPKGDRKVKIDKRFRGMFEDEKFKVKYTVDKRGRPVSHTSNNDLKRYYDLSSDSDEPDGGETSGKFERSSNDDSNELSVPKKNDKKLPDAVKKKLKDLSIDYARGEGCLNSDSSSDDEVSEEESDESDVEHGWGEMDKDAESTEESTRRLAVCNMDWDRIRAVDLMVLFNSFLPANGHIESVTIYPSEFGMKRMKDEEVNGPSELVQNNNKIKPTDIETEEGSKYQMEKLREYQLNRLKYYYAVLICDSVETANKIYSECDGLEYESSATKIDLRFIPDDTTFEQEPKEKCDKLPELSRYQPRFFLTTALQQAKVELTWDETNPNRVEIAKKLSEGKVDDVSEADLQAYLASSSGEESDIDASTRDEEDNDNLNPIDKYRALLTNLEKTSEEKDDKDVEMEITWELNAKDNTEKLVKKKIAESAERTPFQEFLDKRKDKRKIKREERKKKHTDKDDSDSDQDIDMNDPYFAEEFDKPEFKNKKEKKKGKSKNEDIETEQDKAHLELLLLDDKDEKGHFNFKDIEKHENDEKSNKKKRKKYKNKKSTEELKETSDNFNVDVKDARFSAIFTSHHYNIDPTDARYRKTKAMDALIEEKQKRINHHDDTRIKDAPLSKKPKHAELNALVNSVKRKTKNLKKKK